MFGITFNLIKDGEWAWKVYAGKDGSILVFKPERRHHKWVRLNQTWNENGYWVVTIKKADTERVHQLVARAFPLKGSGDRVLHDRDEKDNNEPEWLRWGDAPENVDNRLINLAGDSYVNWNDCDVSTIGLDELPILTGDGGYLSRNGRRREKYLLYGRKWKRRGIAAGQEIKTAMPEKTERTFNGGAFDRDEKVILLPEWDNWEPVESSNAEPFVDCGKGKFLCETLRWRKVWTPFRDRFMDGACTQLKEEFWKPMMEHW